MNPDQPNQQPDPKLQNVHNPLAVMRENEQVLCEIKRHPIGIIGVYFMAGIVMVAVIAAAIIVPTRVTDFSSQDKTALLFGALIVVAVAFLYAYIARVVYKGNRWILTDDSLTQVTQEGLFRKHSSQLSLANLEDVTADQNGILQSIVGYGTLKAETAGERSKFVFFYCPKPNDFARRILEARENFIMNEPGATKRANDKIMVPGMASNYAPPQQPQVQPQAYTGYSPAPQGPLPQAAQPPYDPTQQPPYPQPTQPNTPAQNQGSQGQQ